MNNSVDQVIEVGVISSNASILRHVGSVCREFDYTFDSWSSLEEFMDRGPDCRVIVTNTSEFKGASQDNAAECCQAAKAICNDAFVVCVVQKTIKKEQLPFLKKSGADLILLDHQLTEMSVLEFLLTQQLKARFIPIKASELIGESWIDFHIYHLVPHRAKFLACAIPGALTSSSLERLKKVSEFYINRRDLGAFRDYLESREAESSQDLLSRCRIRFLCLCAAYADLVLLLTDQAELASFEKGLELLNQVRLLCSSLVSVVAEFEDVWEVVDNSSLGNMGSVERSTAVATYAAVFGLRMDLDSVEDVMIGALLTDIGLLGLNSTLLRKMRMQIPLTENEYAQFILHPLASVEIALERKLQMDTRLRRIIAMTHERSDGKGFPERPLPARIPFESQLIQFCQELDSRTLTKMGELKMDPRVVRAQWVEESIQDTDRFGSYFCSQLEKAWKSFNEESVAHAQAKKKALDANLSTHPLRKPISHS